MSSPLNVASAALTGKQHLLSVTKHRGTSELGKILNPPPPLIPPPYLANQTKISAVKVAFQIIVRGK